MQDSSSLNVSSNAPSRRLAAIAFTDIVGYTTLTQRDESLALSLLEEHNALMRSVLRQHRAREVKTIGDAFLVEFESALDALLCAVEIQSAFRDRNNMASSEAERIFVRIGIHVGDVVNRDQDIFGDAVNIASRIVSFSDPGGICISGEVYSQIRNKVKYSIIKLPRQKLKNVEEESDLYRVILPWQEDKHDSSGAAKNRIAILPFLNISPDPSDSYFADGLTEELISALSEIQGLRVVARTSVSRYRAGTNIKDAAEIGSELQVAYILEGSVRKLGNKIRVTTQLIDVATQEHAWSNQYDRNLDDVFQIQSDIAKSVADSLEITLLAGERKRIEEEETRNPAAYVAYLKGRALLHDRTERAIKGAKEQFEIAIKEDPQYARAYAGLADIHMLLGDYLFSPIPESLEEAKSYIQEALELDPNLAEARVSLANSLIYDYKFQEAEREFRKAIAINPSYATAHHWYANCLGNFGRRQEALAEIMLAEELDPLSSVICLSAIYACVGAGRDEQARLRLRKLCEIDPSSPLVNEGFMAYHFTRKEWDEALNYLGKMKELDPSDPYLDADYAYIYAATGRREEALELIDRLKQEIPEASGTKYTLIAFVYAGLNEIDQVFESLEKAYKNRESFFGWFREYPLFENVRKDSRFVEILKRVGLPTTPMP